MKKILVIACAAMMVMGLASLASAAAMPGYDAQWIINLQVTSTSGGSGTTACQFGTGYTGTAMVPWIDGTKAGEDASLPTPASTVAYLYSPDQGGGKMWNQDRRAPLNSEFGQGTKKFWHLKLGAGTSYTDSKIILKAWNPSAVPGILSGSTAYDGAMWTPYDAQHPDVPNKSWFQIRLRLGNSETDPNAPILYTFKPGQTGTSAQPAFTYSFDAGTEYDLTLEAVPEPGSLVAMLSGLVGLVGYGIRRRK